MLGDKDLRGFGILAFLALFGLDWLLVGDCSGRVSARGTRGYVRWGQSWESCFFCVRGKRMKGKG